MLRTAPAPTVRNRANAGQVFANRRLVMNGSMLVGTLRLPCLPPSIICPTHFSFVDRWSPCCSECEVLTTLSVFLSTTSTTEVCRTVCSRPPELSGIGRADHTPVSSAGYLEQEFHISRRDAGPRVDPDPRCRDRGDAAKLHDSQGVFFSNASPRAWASAFMS